MSASPITREVDPKTNEVRFYFACPHCGDLIQVAQSEIRCKVFRHAVWKDTTRGFFNPHANQAECERAVAEGSVFGCTKPFLFDGSIVQVCDYI
jgi:hypothetical protein